MAEQPAVLPPEVRAALAGDPPPAHAVWAAIGASPASSLGETYLVAAGGRLRGLARDSHFDPFVRLLIAPEARPELRAEGFATWLELALEDGSRTRLPLTPFDLEGVKRLVTALGADPSPLPVVLAAPHAAPQESGLDDAVDAGLELLVQAGRRAAQRAELDFVRVRTRVQHSGGWLELEAEYDGKDLAQLRGRGEE